MARRGTKVLQARKTAASRNDDSLLIRSAESLGRVIGSLQRQVHGTSKRVSSLAEDALDAARKAAPRKAKASRKTSGSRKKAGSRKRAGTRTSTSKKR